MSATALPAASPVRDARTPLATLSRVELRKTVDTRSGRWLLVAIALLTAATTVAYTLAEKPELVDFTAIFRVAGLPAAVLLPVVAILLVTSEWTQRTLLTTFTLVPDRRRVVAAKLVVAVILSVAVVVLTIVVAAIANAPGRGDGGWEFSAATLGETYVFQLAGLVGGVAFGLALQSSAAAIVAYFALPAAWGILSSVFSALRDPAKWLDLGQALEPLSEGGVSALEWARAGTASVLWILVPLAIGLWRLERTEVA